MLHAALLCLLATQTSAEPAAATAPAERLFVFAFKNDGADPRQVAALERDVAAAAGARGFDAISSQDLTSMLDVEAARQAAGCVGEASCLAEIAGGLGAAWVITGTVSQLSEDQIELALVLLDRTGTSVHGRGSAAGRDFDSLRNGVTAAVGQLWGDAARETPTSGNGAMRLGLMVGGGITAVVGLVGLVGLVPLSTALTADGDVATAADAFAASGRTADLQGFFDASATRDAAAADWNSWGAIAVASGLTLATVGVVLVGVGATTAAE